VELRGVADVVGVLDEGEVGEACHPLLHLQQQCRRARGRRADVEAAELEHVDDFVAPLRGQCSSSRLCYSISEMRSPANNFRDLILCSRWSDTQPSTSFIVALV
jgi:hypothetical protein